jgi:signal transduction histidine kinase
MKRNIPSRYFPSLFLILLSLGVWELWLEPYISPLYGAESEPAGQNWLFLIPIAVFCAFLLYLVFSQFKKAEENVTKADYLFDSDKKRTTQLQEKTVELASMIQLHDDAKNGGVDPGKKNESINVSLQTLIDSISDSLMVIDGNYQVRMMNKAAKDTHLNDNQSLSDTILCHKLTHDMDSPCSEPEHECPFHEVMKTGVSCTVLHHHHDSHGNTIPYEILASPIHDASGNIVGIVELARDVSSRIAREKKQKESDARLLNLQREQSIATLAGGLAHEFNNTLTAILGNAELLSTRMVQNDDNRELTESIIKGSEHLADLTKQLLAYAKGGKYRSQSILVNAQIKDSLRLIHTDKFPNIEVELDLHEDLWPVLGDPAQLSQLIMNVIINGFEALENKKGTLLISTTNEVKTDQWECKAKEIHPPGYYVLIRVTNTGSTISEELLDKIFDPFFSTKYTGRGMGLAAAKGIVQNHNGCISVISRNDKTTFYILLPREIPDKEFMKDNEASPAEVLDLNVLIIDDDPHVLSIIRSLLAHHGCNVTSTDKGVEAVKHIEQHRDTLDLVILDIQMPDLSGDKVYKMLKEIKSDLKVLISSGHDEYTALKDIRLDPKDRFIKKPFRMSDLILKVKELAVN